MYTTQVSLHALGSVFYHPSCLGRASLADGIVLVSLTFRQPMVGFPKSGEQEEKDGVAFPECSLL